MEAGTAPGGVHKSARGSQAAAVGLSREGGGGESFALECVIIRCPEDQWTHDVTDGSAAEATRDGDGGVCVGCSDGGAHIAIATVKYSTKFRAEAGAPKGVAIEIRDNLPETKNNTVIFTDALSVLNKLQGARRGEVGWGEGGWEVSKR